MTEANYKGSRPAAMRETAAFPYPARFVSDQPFRSTEESSFYGEDTGATIIMSLANFPDDLFPLLQMESLSTYEAIQFFRCEILVELGCYDGRNLEIARRLGIRYRGIDLNRRAIDVLKTRIEREGMSDLAESVVDDILNQSRDTSAPSPGRPLYLLPFNLAGNFRDPKPLLKQLAAPRFTAVICMFKDSLEATRLRQAYYLRCGVKDLVLERLEDGDLYTGSDGFFSRSYSGEALEALLGDCGLTIVRSSENSVAICVTVRAARHG